MTSFCLRGANVLDESGEFTGPLDVSVEHGRVAAVGRELAPAPRWLDATGLFLLPASSTATTT